MVPTDTDGCGKLKPDTYNKDTIKTLYIKTISKLYNNENNNKINEYANVKRTNALTACL